MKTFEKENIELKKEITELKKILFNENKKNYNNNKMLFQQSRMASMGEMIGNIAHQWRQPLMELSSITMGLEAKLETLGKLTNEEILDSIEKSNEITNYMSQTIDDFRNFFAKDKEKVQFKITDQVSSAINILNSSLSQKNIKLDIIVVKNSTVIGFKNEYSQVLINIISNAKDALISRNIKNPRIIVKIREKEESSVVEIEDNAGGINIEPIQKVFEPFFTENKINGTGIGLFMSKLIIENNMGGRLFVENGTLGAKFIISVPKRY